LCGLVQGRDEKVCGRNQHMPIHGANKRVPGLTLLLLLLLLLLLPLLQLPRLPYVGIHGVSVRRLPKRGALHDGADRRLLGRLRPRGRGAADAQHRAHRTHAVKVGAMRQVLLRGLAGRHQVAGQVVRRLLGRALPRAGAPAPPFAGLWPLLHLLRVWQRRRLLLLLLVVLLLGLLLLGLLLLLLLLLLPAGLLWVRLIPVRLLLLLILLLILLLLILLLLLLLLILLVGVLLQLVSRGRCCDIGPPNQGDARRRRPLQLADHHGAIPALPGALDRLHAGRPRAWQRDGCPEGSGGSAERERAGRGAGCALAACARALRLRGRAMEQQSQPRLWSLRDGTNGHPPSSAGLLRTRSPLVAWLALKSGVRSSKKPLR
jgi:hypothetical protein